MLEQRSGQASTAQRFVDPHRLQVQAATEDAAGQARRNGAVRVAHEYGELLLLVHAGSRGRGLGDLRLKEGEVTGVGGRLDGHGEPVADLDGVRRQSTAPISCSINAISSK